MRMITPLVLGIVLAQNAGAQVAPKMGGQSSLEENPAWLICIQEGYPSKDELKECLTSVLVECTQLDRELTTACINGRRDTLVQFVDDFAAEYRQSTTEAGKKIFNAELTHSQRTGEAACDYYVQLLSRPDDSSSTPESLRAPCELNEAAKMYGRIVLERTTH